MVKLTRGYVETLSQLPEHVKIFYISQLELTQGAREVLKKESAWKVIEILQEDLKGMKEITADTVKRLLTTMRTKTGRGGKTSSCLCVLP